MSYPAKTPQGVAALRERDERLRPRDRQIMVMANGQRSVAELETLFGTGLRDDVDRLSDLGFLALRLQPRPLGGQAQAPAAVRPVSGSARLPDAVEALRRADATVALTPAVPPAPRRSLAATKMYTIDMLQMMRRPEASAMAVSVQTSENESELIDSVQQSLELMATLSGPGYALKVSAQLTAIVPPVHEARLQQQAQRWVDAVV